MRQFIQLFNRVGGVSIAKQYFKAHVLIYAIIMTVLNGFSKKSLEIVRLAVNNKILSRLRKKYGKFIEEQKRNISITGTEEGCDKVWVFWLQGLENAPNIVKCCYQSICDNIKDKEIILLTAENYMEYVEFPEYIQEKIKKGIITSTHMSDLIRLELLTKYGGTWIDATVFCSGNNIPDYMLNSDLFMFQNMKPGLDGDCSRISSWFITARKAHPILVLTKVLLYKYWEKYNYMKDYFLLHDFMELAIETYPEEWNLVIPFCNATPHILLLRLFEPFDDRMWDKIRIQTPFHKLTYKFSVDSEDLKYTYYDRLLR